MILLTFVTKWFFRGDLEFNIAERLNHCNQSTMRLQRWTLSGTSAHFVLRSESFPRSFADIGKVQLTKVEHDCNRLHDLQRSAGRPAAYQHARSPGFNRLFVPPNMLSQNDICRWSSILAKQS